MESRVTDALAEKAGRLAELVARISHPDTSLEDLNDHAFGANAVFAQLTDQNTNGCTANTRAFKRGSGISSDCVKWCSKCFTEFQSSDLGYCAICGSEALTSREERKVELEAKAQSLKQLYMKQQRDRDFWKRYQATREVVKSKHRGGTDYERWSAWAPDSSDDDEAVRLPPVTPVKSTAFIALEAKYAERDAEDRKRLDIESRCLLAGSQFESEGKLILAFEKYVEGLNSYSSSLKLRVAIARTELALGRLDACETTLSDVLKNIDMDQKSRIVCDALTVRGSLLMKKKLFKEAISDFEKATYIPEDIPELTELIRECRIRLLGKSEEAVWDMVKAALPQDPETACKIIMSIKLFAFPIEVTEGLIDAFLLTRSEDLLTVLFNTSQTGDQLQNFLMHSSYRSAFVDALLTFSTRPALTLLFRIVQKGYVATDDKRARVVQMLESPEIDPLTLDPALKLCCLWAQKGPGVRTPEYTRSLVRLLHVNRSSVYSQSDQPTVEEIVRGNLCLALSQCFPQYGDLIPESTVEIVIDILRKDHFAIRKNAAKLVAKLAMNRRLKPVVVALKGMESLKQIKLSA